MHAQGGYKRLKVHPTFIYSCHSFGRLYKLVIGHLNNYEILANSLQLRVQFSTVKDRMNIYFIGNLIGMWCAVLFP